MLPQPLTLLIAITLGIPLVLVTLVINASDGVNPALLRTIIGGVIFSIFMTLFIFEIKRIADIDDHPEEH